MDFSEILKLASMPNLKVLNVSPEYREKWREHGKMFPHLNIYYEELRFASPYEKLNDVGLWEIKVKPQSLKHFWKKN